MTPATPRLRQALPPVYAAAALRFALPVLVLPLVAARVGPEEFGRLGFILVWATLLSTLVEGGFLAAATRLAVHADADRRRAIAQQVFSARCVLSLLAAALAVPVVIGVGDGAPADIAAIALLAVAIGWPATWYLQATQQLARWARVEFAVYALLLVLSWAFAHSVGVYLALHGAAAAALAALGWRWLWRDLNREPGAPGPAGQSGRWSLWQGRQVRPGLSLGWQMLPVAIAGAAYSYALPAAASAQLAKAELGLYYLADRIVRAVLAAGEPVFALVYPRIVQAFVQGPAIAWRLARRWALAGALAGAALWAAGALAWPGIAALAAQRQQGLDLARLAEVMAILGALLPLLLGWKFIGYAMLGSGRHDRAYRACVVAGAVVGVLVAATFGGAAGATGLAWTAIGVECVVIAVALIGMRLSARRSARSA